MLRRWSSSSGNVPNKNYKWCGPGEKSLQYGNKHGNSPEGLATYRRELWEKVQDPKHYLSFHLYWMEVDTRTHWLVCSCKLSDPCHCDILIKAAKWLVAEKQKQQ